VKKKTTKLETEYILTVTNPDELDPEGFDDTLDNCEAFTSAQAAKRALKSWLSRTNMDVYLLKVELVGHGRGEL
jgi:hypothetical protein